MAVRTVVAINLLIGILTASASRSVSAEPTSLESGVAQLLELGQRYSPRALADARKQHERLSQLPHYNARVRYAFALVLIKQRASDEALKTLDAVLADQPDLLPAWRSKVWTQMSAHKYAPAIQSMRAAAAVMAKKTKKNKELAAGAPPDANAAERTDTARFFGRTFGFLEGPRGHAVAAEELRKAKQYVQSRLGDDLAAFTEGEEEISAEFVKAHERLQKTEAESAAEFADQEAALKQQQKKVDKAEADVEFQAEKLQTTTKAQLEDLAKQAGSIQQNMTQAQFRLNAIDQVIAVQQAQATNQNAAINQPGQQDAFTRAAAIRQLNLIQLNLQQLSAQRNTLAQQMVGLNQQLLAIAAQRTALVGDEEQSASDLKTQATQLKRKERELGKAQKKAAKGRVSPGNAARALTEQQQAFGTYEPFPFDAEKERVLNWFEKN